MSNLAETLKIIRQMVDDTLDKLLVELPHPENRVVQAMRYATIGGGKALRPFLVMETARMFGVPFDKSVRVATAAEMVHSYSLIHDDLPCMDDDDLRRGKPSCHKQFDEATAVLAGDGLLTRAFEVLAADTTWDNPAVRCELVHLLGNAAGYHGMVAGQMLDLMAENESLELSLTDVVRLQSLKTGRMLIFSAEAGAVLGQATFEQRQALKDFAADIGLAFQITDDILDIEGSVEKVGKTLRKDVDAGKITYVSLVGVDAARQKAAELIDKAVARLQIFGDKADLLRDLARFILSRDY